MPRHRTPISRPIGTRQRTDDSARPGSSGIYYPSICVGVGATLLGLMAFHPLSRTCEFMLKEEAHHMFVGTTGVDRVVQRTAELMREHDTDDVRRFVERFALLLTGAGWPRMPARVFACLLADEGDGMTAGDLARRLSVSAAAVSGATRNDHAGTLSGAWDPTNRAGAGRAAGT